MSPRPRNSGNRDLPPHTTTTTSKGITYYVYVMPNGSRHSLGKDKADAVAAALTLNAELRRNPEILARILRKQQVVEEVKNPIPPLSYAVEQYRLRLAQKTYAASTRENHDYMLNEYVSRWGDKRVNDLAVIDVAALLNEKPAHSYIKHRIMLIDLWAYITHQGWAPDNIAERTMEAIVPPKVRQRHTPEALAAIRAISPDYLQRAIDLALNSLQRRADLVKISRTMINIPANTLTVLQEKSRNYKKPVYIEVDMHPELLAAVMSCLTTPLAFKCPYLLHYRPARNNKKQQMKKLHHLAMTEDFLTREFGRYRDLSGVYADLDPAQQPSFHDLRALGITQVTEKYGKGYAMALAGHADERMWEHYMEGHDEPKPVRVSFR